MTQTIEQLQARVAELESQAINLKSMLDDSAALLRAEKGRHAVELDNETTELRQQLQSRIKELEGEVVEYRLANSDIHKWRTSYRAQLAAAQAEIKRLREALEPVVAAGYLLTVKEHNRCREALAQPSDTSALDAYVAEKVKEETDEYAALSDRLSKLLAETAIALKGEEAALTRHSWHDLPVVALSKMVEISELTRQRDLAVDALTSISKQSMGEDGCYYSNRACIRTAKNALSAIKESEKPNG